MFAFMAVLSDSEILLGSSSIYRERETKYMDTHKTLNFLKAKNHADWKKSLH